MAFITTPPALDLYRQLDPFKHPVYAELPGAQTEPGPVATRRGGPPAAHEEHEEDGVLRLVSTSSEQLQPSPVVLANT
jgi:hypothetical protein